MQIGTNGIISFGQPFYFYYPSLFPTRYFWTRNTYLVAPFWSDVDIVRDGSVCYQVHEKGDGYYSDRMLRQISTFIELQFEAGDDVYGFEGIWMLVVQWEDTHMYPYTFASRYPRYYSARQREQLEAVRLGCKTLTFLTLLWH